MSIGDAEYLEWLKADAQIRIVLVEAKCYTGGAETTRYMSNGVYVSAPADTPANTPYDDIVTSVPSITWRMSETFTGRTTITWGDIEIDNSSGERDSWLTDAWDGRAISLYLGSPDWARADFRHVVTGLIDDIEAPSPDKLSLRLRDKTAALNVPLQTALVGGTDAHAGQPIPACCGQCFNVEPLLVDAATSTYQVHDGQIEDITAVRDNGVALAYPAGYTKDLANGKFALAAAPSGRITADIKGAKPSGTYHTKIADIVKHLVTTYTALTGSDIDTSNFSAFNTACPQLVGLYAKSRLNLIEALDALVTSVGGFYTFSRGGLMQLGQLAAPSGSPVLELTDDDVVFRSLKIKRRLKARETVRLGYERNWTPQPDGLAAGVSEANRARYAAEYLAKSYSDASVLTAHPGAVSPDLEPSLLVSGTDAATEAQRRQELYAAPRTIYEATCYTAPLHLTLGDLVSLDHPRFGFAGGALARIVGISENLTTGRVTLDLWK